MRKYHKQSGTTVIEVVIATFIILVGIMGGLGLAMQSSSRVGLSQEEIIATNLAREAIEVVRNMRDSNWLQGDAWDKGILGDATEPGGILSFNATNNKWTISHLSNPVGALDNETSRLYLKNDIYSTDSSGEKTKLKRVVKISQKADGGKNIQAMVRVEFKGLTREVVLEDDLYDWK